MHRFAITPAVLSFLFLGFSNDTDVLKTTTDRVEFHYLVADISNPRIVAHGARELFLEALFRGEIRLLRWDGESVTSVSPYSLFPPTITIDNDLTALFLCTASHGLFFFKTDGSAAPVPVPEQDNCRGIVHGRQVASYYYLASIFGVTRWRPGEKPTTLLRPVRTLSEFDVQEYGRGVIVNTGGGAFLWMPGSPPSEVPSQVAKLKSFQGSLWYSTREPQQLYRWQPGQPPIPVVTHGVLFDLAVFEDSLFVQTTQGVFLPTFSNPLYNPST